MHVSQVENFTVNSDLLFKEYLPISQLATIDSTGALETIVLMRLGYINTVVLDQLPYTKKVIEDLGTLIGVSFDIVTYKVLKPNSSYTLLPTSFNYTTEFSYHIPVVTNNLAEAVYEDGTTYNLNMGTVYKLESNIPYTAKNGGSVDRVHLVLQQSRPV